MGPCPAIHQVADMGRHVPYVLTWRVSAERTSVTCFWCRVWKGVLTAKATRQMPPLQVWVSVGQRHPPVQAPLVLQSTWGGRGGVPH